MLYMKRRIYRLENNYGQGPFTVIGAYEMVSAERAAEYVIHVSGVRFEPHSHLESRFKVRIPSTHHYGCPSLETLMEWFPDYTHDTLHRRGFTVVIYEVDSDDISVETENQVAFDLLNSKAVDILTIEEAYDQYLNEYLGLVA